MLRRYFIAWLYSHIPLEWSRCGQLLDTDRSNAEGTHWDVTFVISCGIPLYKLVAYWLDRPAAISLQPTISPEPKRKCDLVSKCEVVSPSALCLTSKSVLRQRYED